MVYTTSVALMYQVAANRAHEGRRRRWAGIDRFVSVPHRSPRKQPVVEADAHSECEVRPRGVLVRTETRRVVYGADVGHTRISAQIFNVPCTVKISKADRLQPIFDHNLRIWYKVKRVCVPFWAPLAAEGPSHAPFELFPTTLLRTTRYTLIWCWWEVPSLSCIVVVKFTGNSVDNIT